MRTKQVKMSQSSLLLPIQLFFFFFSFFNKYSTDCYKPLVIFRVPKKLNLIIFASVFIAFMEDFSEVYTCSFY